VIRYFGLGLGGFWVWVLGLDTNTNPKPKFFLGPTNSEFNSIHFGMKIKKKKEDFMSAKNFLGLKNF
jgi:hypothetical protein